MSDYRHFASSALESERRDAQDMQDLDSQRWSTGSPPETLSEPDKQASPAAETAAEEWGMPPAATPPALDPVSPDASEEPSVTTDAIQDAPESAPDASEAEGREVAPVPPAAPESLSGDLEPSPEAVFPEITETPQDDTASPEPLSPVSAETAVAPDLATETQEPAHAAPEQSQVPLPEAAELPAPEPLSSFDFEPPPMAGLDSMPHPLLPTESVPGDPSQVAEGVAWSFERIQEEIVDRLVKDAVPLVVESMAAMSGTLQDAMQEQAEQFDRRHLL